MGSGMILDFPAGREFGSEFFNFRVNATVACASLCINSGLVRAHLRFSRVIGAGNFFARGTELFRAGRESSVGTGMLQVDWFHGIDLLLSSASTAIFPCSNTMA